jgi:hypothetical protein
MFRFSMGLYKDELFYSLVGRNLSLESKDVALSTLDNLRIKNRIPNIQFCSYLNRYKDLIPDHFNYCNDFIIQNSTLFPLYAPFLSHERKTAIINRMIGDSSNGLLELLGVPGGHLFNMKKILK